MMLRSLLDCLATRESLMFALQNRFGPLVGIERLSPSELAQMAIRLGVHR